MQWGKRVEEGGGSRWWQCRKWKPMKGHKQHRTMKWGGNAESSAVEWLSWVGQQWMVALCLEPLREASSAEFQLWPHGLHLPLLFPLLDPVSKYKEVQFSCCCWMSNTSMYQENYNFQPGSEKYEKYKMNGGKWQIRESEIMTIKQKVTSTKCCDRSLLWYYSQLFINREKCW